VNQGRFSPKGGCDEAFSDCVPICPDRRGGRGPVRELATQAVPYYKSRAPYFRHGYLILSPAGGPNGSPVASVLFTFYPYGLDGKLEYDGTVEVPGGSQPVVRDVDFDTDGNAAVAVTAAGGASGHLLGILLVDNAGRQTRFINTGFFLPGPHCRCPGPLNLGVGMANGPRPSAFSCAAGL
jgi:hypothetical protein